MGRNGERAKMPSDGNEEGDGNVIILCFTDVKQVVPGGYPVEQRVPPVLGAPNVGRNVSSHSVPYRLECAVPREKFYMNFCSASSLGTTCSTSVENKFITF
ncbi:hypothetical protein TB2_001682 [Malus domestica]